MRYAPQHSAVTAVHPLSSAPTLTRLRVCLLFSARTALTEQILLFNFATEEVEHVDLNIKEPTFMRWSKLPGSQQLAIGTGRGELLLYDRSQRLCWFAAARHKKRITCGSWNASSSQFAFASDDRQITICNTADGKTFGQVKVKSKPTNVKFGGNDGSDVGRENIVSVSMDRKTILLYNLDDPENALELAFQQRYGAIVSFKWSTIYARESIEMRGALRERIITGNDS